MNRDDRLRRRYLGRFQYAIGTLVLLAIPAIIHSHAAIETLYNHPSDWVPNSIAEKAAYNEFERHFPVTNLLMIAWDGSDLRSPSLVRATSMLRPLAQDASEPESNGGRLEPLPPWVAESIAEIRSVAGTETPFRWVRNGSEMLDRLTSPPVNLTEESAIRRLQGTLVGPQGRQTCLLLSLTEQSSQHRRLIVPKIRGMIARLVDQPVGAIAVVGSPFEGAMVDLESIRSVRLFSPPSAVVAAIICFICLRSIWMTAAITAVAVIGEGLVLAAVYYTGVPMNAVLIVLPPLVFVLTVSAGIHLSNYFLDAAYEFPEISLADAAQRAMKAGVAPCTLAAVTTVIGLCSLLLVRLQPVRVFGAVASVGVLLTLLLLLLVLPGAMVLSRPPRGEGKSREESNHGLRARMRTWMRHRLVQPWTMIFSFLAIAAVLSLGLTRLESTVNIPRMFLPDSDLRVQYNWFEEHLGPTSTGDVLVKFPPLGEDDDPLERLAVVARLHGELLQRGVVGGAMSAMTFIPPVPRSRSLGATAERSAIRALLRDPESSIGQLGFIAHAEGQELWRINLRLPQHQRADFGDDIDAIEQVVHQVIADVDHPVEYSLTGSVVIIQRSQEILLADLFRSFMTAFGVIAVVMMLMLRSVIGGLLAMAPNLFPTVTLFGFMGLTATPLDIGSVMSASVALGIAVDDTVHLLSRFGSRRARGFGQIRAAMGALRQCGWAMFQTTLVCGMSLMVYWLSPFVPTSRFSLFMFGLLSSALLGVLLLLPALMATRLGHWLSRAVGSDATASVYADRPPREGPHDIRRLPTRWQSTAG